jgi:BMFP domain-containing protein YqiC
VCHRLIALRIIIIAIKSQQQCNTCERVASAETEESRNLGQAKCRSLFREGGLRPTPPNKLQRLVVHRKKRRYRDWMQTKNPFFDEFAKLATGAAGVAQGFGEEARTFWRSQTERMIADMDLVRRDEFDVVKDLAQTARAEVEALKLRVQALEDAVQSANKAAPKPAAKAASSKARAEKS